MSDNELIKQLIIKAQDNDPDAKNELYKILYTRILNYCNTILKDYHYAQEVTNTVFRKVFDKNIGSDYFISYLYKAAMNESINMLKKIQRRKKRELEYNKPIDWDTEMQAFIPDEKAENPRKIAINKEKINAIDRFCVSLPEKQRKIYELHKEGWTSKEIAEELSVNYGAIRVRMARLKQKIHKFVKKTDGMI